jgi:uncharacterized membrane protein YfhO
MPLINNSTLGNAWFVPEVKWVESADDEIALVGEINPIKEAVVDTKFSNELEGFHSSADTGLSYIELTSYAPNKLTYKSNSNIDQLALFSEIYYPKGWKAKIDGEPASHFRANYILRAMIIPKGEHTIEFEFRPASYYTGEKVALASSVILLLLILGVLFKEIKNLTQQKD